VFLYKHVLDISVEGLIDPIRAKNRRRPPTVMTQNEVRRVFACLHGPHLLMAQMLYGSGLRLMECIRLRIQDLAPELQNGSAATPFATVLRPICLKTA
jgi:integrase